MLRKISLLWPHLFCNVEFEFSWFHNTKQSSEILILNCCLNFKTDEFWNYWIPVNDFGFALGSPDIDLWNIDLSDTHTFRFVRYRYPHFFFLSPRRLEDVFKTRLQDVFKTCIQYVFKTCLQYVFIVTVFRHPRRLQDVIRDVFKTCWKTKNCYAEDVLKTNKCLLGSFNIFR